MVLLLLRWMEEGLSRLGATRRAGTDLLWRAAMGLQLDAPTPNEKTLRDFEAFLRSRHPDSGTSRYLLFHEHIVRLCRNAGVVGDDAIWTMDSTPMWCYGAVLDTVRLLGDGTRKLAQRWAAACKVSFNGFKLHLAGDLVSGLSSAVAVTAGNAHDSVVAHRLIRRAKELHEDIEQVLADPAYGAAALRHRVRGESQVHLLSPPPPNTRPAGRLGRDTIEFDFLAHRATCAAGVPTDDHEMVWSSEHQVLMYRHTAGQRRFAEPVSSGRLVAANDRVVIASDFIHMSRSCDELAKTGAVRKSERLTGNAANVSAWSIGQRGMEVDKRGVGASDWHNSRRMRSR
jgi:hypothetical protein